MALAGSRMLRLCGKPADRSGGGALSFAMRFTKVYGAKKKCPGNMETDRLGDRGIERIFKDSAPARSLGSARSQLKNGSESGVSAYQKT